MKKKSFNTANVGKLYIIIIVLYIVLVSHIPVFIWSFGWFNSINQCCIQLSKMGAIFISSSIHHFIISRLVYIKRCHPSFPLRPPSAYYLSINSYPTIFTHISNLYYDIIHVKNILTRLSSPSYSVPNPHSDYTATQLQWCR